MNYTIMNTKEFQNKIKSHQIISSWYSTEAGALTVLSSELGIHEASFHENLQALPYISSESTNLLLVGTPFQCKVWQAALQIPQGTTLTYQELAYKIGKPKAHRAVANAFAQNKIAYFIPCHRIVHKGGKLAGYRWGTDRKMKLLQSEQK